MYRSSSSSKSSALSVDLEMQTLNREEVLTGVLRRLSAGDKVKSALVSEEVTEWIEVMNAEELSTLIRLYNNLLPHIKT